MKKLLFALIFAFAFIGSALYSQNSLTIKNKVKSQSLGIAIVEYNETKPPITLPLAIKGITNLISETKKLFPLLSLA
jgi:hypothetical protein